MQNLMELSLVKWRFLQIHYLPFYEKNLYLHNVLLTVTYSTSIQFVHEYTDSTLYMMFLWKFLPYFCY